MKKLLTSVPLAFLLLNCGAPKSTQTGSTASQRFNLPVNAGSGNSLSSDTLVMAGTQFIPILGKSETGVIPQLEGTWILQTMNGKTILESDVNIPAPPKMAPGTEMRHDSVTTSETVKGVTRTTTTVEVDRMGNPVKRITPPQGSSYHIPQRPSINFFGSNETFSGFTGCNKFSGRYVISDSNSVSLKSATASTKMVCIGDYDEGAFLNTLHRVTAFKSNSGQLQLLEGDNVILVFRKGEEK